MTKTSTKLVGDQLFTKVDYTSPWEPTRLYELKSILSDRDTPYSKEEKAKLPQFGFGRKSGETSNQQIYPTKILVCELDTPPKFKKDIDQPEVFRKWQSFFISLYNKVIENGDIPFWYMYLTPSMCGIRFIVKLENAIIDEDEYKSVVKAFLSLLNSYEVNKSFYDISVNNAWYLPTHKPYFAKGRRAFVNPVVKNIKLQNEISKAITLTEEAKSFEEGNRNRFIYQLGRNSNRLGIEKKDLLEYISNSDLFYDESEINTAIKSAYKKTEDFGIWKGRSDIDNATVSLHSLFRRAKNTKPIPVIWSGIKEGSLGFIFGPSKSGKSTLCECLAMSLETGMDSFMGLPLTGNKYKVLFISMEEYWEQRVERNKQQRTYLFKSSKKKLGNNYFTNNEKFPTHILNDEDLKFIEIEINKHEPEVVFIDSFTRLVLDKVEDSSRTNRVMSKLKKMCSDTGATFILIHHTTKAKDKSLGILNMAGSRVLSQEADFLIGIAKAPNEQRYLKDVAFRYVPEREKVTPFEINEFRWAVPGKPLYEEELVAKQDGRKDEANKTAIYDFLKSADEPVPAMQVKDHFDGHMSKKTIFNNLNKLLAEGKIEKVEKGIYKCSVDNKD